MGPSQSRYKKGHMTNVYLTDSDQEAIVDFMKDQEELYNKTSEHFKDKARKESLWEEFKRSRKLSVKVCKTWFDSQRTQYGRLKSGQGPDGNDGMSDLDTGQLGFLRSHIKHKGLSKSSAFTTSPEPLLTQTVWR